VRLFITGASGFLGKNFIKQALKKNNVLIYALSRKKILLKKIIWVKGDLGKSWKKKLSKSDILVHIASSGVNESNKENVYETNFFQSKNLLNEAVKSKCKKWLIISTSSEYGIRSNKIKKINVKTNRIPYSDYGLSKAIFTDYCKKLAFKSGSKCRIMRLFPFHGRFEASKRFYPSIMSSISKGKDFKVFNPGEVRAFSDVDFISKVLVDALNFKKNNFKSFQIWNVSENKVNSIKDFASELWKKKRAKGILTYKKNFFFYSHVPDKNSLWTLDARKKK
jgi:nucleoside-diphosphate-sugar epimerase